MYGYVNNGFAMGAGPAMQQRLQYMQEMQGQAMTPPQQYNNSPAFLNMAGGLRGRAVTSIEEAKAAQIELDGTIFYFPSLAENKIYTKSVGLDGMPIFNVYSLGTTRDNNLSLESLSKRVELLEDKLKGAVYNVSSTNDATDGVVTE